MDNSQALDALIAQLEASSRPVSFAWSEVEQWEEGVLARFVAIGLLVKDVNAWSLQCRGCEHRCFMDVLLANDGSDRAFIVCDHPEMQNQMGRINVPPLWLQQWQSSPRHMAVVIARLLGFTTKPEQQKGSTSFKLGMRKGENGRQWMMLHAQPLVVESNRHTVPLADLLYFDCDELQVDELRVDELVNAKSKETGKLYSSNIDKQEARKLVTQAMYQDWSDEYLRLKQKHPDKSATWHSMQIAKMPIAQGKVSETIRKNMKI